MRARFAAIVGVLGLTAAACETPRTGLDRDLGPASQVFDFEAETHFRCYIVSRQTPQPADTAILTDQFLHDTVRIDEPLQLCAPTSKDGAAIPDTTEHLTIYGAPDTLVPHLIVETEDQFGPRTLEAVGARYLLVPTDKNAAGFPANLNHYRCYEVTGDRARETVSLEDQFGTDENVRVERPHYFCNPVEKTTSAGTSPILEPEVHLTCYEIFAPQRTEATDVDISNQIEEDTFTVTAFELLCVPSAKGTVTPAE